MPATSCLCRWTNGTTSGRCTFVSYAIDSCYQKVIDPLVRVLPQLQATLVALDVSCGVLYVVTSTIGLSSHVQIGGFFSHANGCGVQLSLDRGDDWVYEQWISSQPVRKLQLGWCDWPLTLPTSDLFATIFDCRTVESFIMSSSPIPPLDIPPRPSFLQDLELEGCDIVSNRLTVLSRVVVGSNLRRFMLEQCSNTSDTSGLYNLLEALGRSDVTDLQLTDLELASWDM
ncbi:Aste57867_19208 [Aphanomyces stellatus]|uniref:Aste57867_19208 protein n=1 Tax=Aphanomyces stellatus TaxID=120398 RepID=A0A485LDG9_9STRA|nr:hypothetical protein As57867_019144 [Aphanomyces stellatus]VFT95929.1 Aste57867_19208 [Aphanomyces stellatus]